MKPTHTYTNSQGHTFSGVIIAESCWNGCWFLPMCDDNKTWMKEPIWVVGVRKIS